MTREKAFQDPELMAELLCDLVQETIWNAEKASDAPYHIPFACKICPAAKWCKVGHSGFHGWLQEEAEVIE